MTRDQAFGRPWGDPTGQPAQASAPTRDDLDRHLPKIEDLMVRSLSGDHPTAAEMAALFWYQRLRLSEAAAEYRTCAKEAAIRKSQYRQVASKCLIQSGPAPGHKSKPIAERQAQVDQKCEEYRKSAYVTEALSKSALEALRTERDQLGLLQSLKNLIEAEAAATGNQGI